MKAKTGRQAKLVGAILIAYAIIKGIEAAIAEYTEVKEIK